MPAHDWYTIVAFGEADWTDVPPLPHGPWHGREQAEAALQRWEHNGTANGYPTGSAKTYMRARVAGPFCTREIARDADISEGNKRVCRHNASVANQKDGDIY